MILEVGKFYQWRKTAVYIINDKLYFNFGLEDGKLRSYDNVSELGGYNIIPLDSKYRRVCIKAIIELYDHQKVLAYADW